MNQSDEELALSDEEIVLERRMQNLLGEMQELLPFFEESSITNIFVLPNGRVRIEDFFKGRYSTDIYLKPSRVRRIIDFVASMQDRQIDENKIPTLETTIPKYGFRFSAVVPGWVEIPQLTIRRPSNIIIPLEEWLKKGGITESEYDVLVEAIKGQKNIVIGGATSSGKTTFLNSCIAKQVALFPEHRYLVIEDTPELSCSAEDCSIWLIKKSQAADAVEFSLRFTPDHIIFGEVRTGAVLEEIITSWMTGHSGNFTTIHANSAKGIIERMQSMVKDETIKKDIVGTIHLCVHLSNKKVSEVLKVDDINQFSKTIEQLETQGRLYKGLYDNEQALNHQAEELLQHGSN